SLFSHQVAAYRSLPSSPTRRSSDLLVLARRRRPNRQHCRRVCEWRRWPPVAGDEAAERSRLRRLRRRHGDPDCLVAEAGIAQRRSEEHTSELSHVATSYAVFCLKKK